MISSRNNERLKAIRRLRLSKVRAADGSWPALLLEGPHLVRTALDLNLTLDFILVEPTARRELADLVTVAERRGCRCFDVEPALLREGADADSPRGVLALARKAQPLPEEFLAVDSGHLRMLYLDGVQDPGNVGALIRSAAAVGCHAVLAAPHTCRWEHPRVLRASAATALGIPLLWNLEPARLRQLTALPWLALEAHHGDSLWQAELPAGGVLVVGSEAHGISPQTRPFVQLGLNIPLAPEVESLNAAVAAAVVLFEWQRRTLG